jgi:hypothetical protein
MIPIGTLIIGKNPEYQTTFASFPERDVGVIIKVIPPDKHDIQSLYVILFLDGVHYEYESVVKNYYETIQ